MVVVVRATAALVAGLLLAGCGGAAPAARVHGGRVEITLDEYLIRPQDVTAPAGRLELTIVDRGRLRHNFRLYGPHHEAARVTTLFPGEQVVRTADLAPGEYRMVCTVSNHAELGMTGRLIVR